MVTFYLAPLTSSTGQQITSKNQPTNPFLLVFIPKQTKGKALTLQLWDTAGIIS
jgi:hypothetical protein